MPETKYMVVDPRRDHSLRIPRPDLTVSLGIPNACNLCHDDASKGETPQWAQEQVEKWYGEREGPPHFAHAFDAGRKGDPEGATSLVDVARRKDTRPMVRASAISLLARYRSGAARRYALEGLEHPDELVRTVSVRSIEELFPSDPEGLCRRLAAALHDPVRAVRMEAARVLTMAPRSPLSREDARAFDAALAEYVQSQEALADQPGAHLNMAVVYDNLASHETAPATNSYEEARGFYETRRAKLEQMILSPEGVSKTPPEIVEEEAKKALAALEQNFGETTRRYHALVRKATQKAYEAYQVALRVDPDFVPARNNLALLHNRRGEKDEAEKQLRRIIELEPEMAAAHYSLGLLIAENEQRTEEAIEFLATAARLWPENPGTHRNYGLALQWLKRFEEAERELRTAHEVRRVPNDTKHLYALTNLYVKQKKWPQAKVCARELLKLQPNVPEWRQLLEHIERESKAAEGAKAAP
jgi:tetratricopeptide (TPR) repeat protein